MWVSMDEQLLQVECVGAPVFLWIQCIPGGASITTPLLKHPRLTLYRQLFPSTVGYLLNGSGPSLKLSSKEEGIVA